MKKIDIGIIGAMKTEVESLISRLDECEDVTVGSVTFHTGVLCGKRVAIAQCGVGKVYAALATEAMIIAFSPKLVVNTGVGGALNKALKPTDIVFANKLVQHDMDTSPLGDPKGLISGINKVFFDTDERAVEILTESAKALGYTAYTGIVASADRFVADKSDKDSIVNNFGADVCEMEGAAVAQVAYVNGVSFCVIRAISDSADEGSSMDYLKFLPIAAERSAALTMALCEKY